MTEKKKTTKEKSEKEVKKPRKKKIEAPKVEEVKAAAPIVHHQPKPKKIKVPKTPKTLATGRRKEATARVFLIAGSGKVTVNGHDYQHYFCARKLLEFQVMRPLVVSGLQNNYDVVAEAYGGGIPGQAGAVSLGIAKALVANHPDLRVKLKREGLLRRDPRMKERKKYGLKRARRAFQFTKR